MKIPADTTAPIFADLIFNYRLSISSQRSNLRAHDLKLVLVLGTFSYDVLSLLFGVL